MAEIRPIYRAKSGDVNAFVELYDSYVERVYRYIHFLVPNNRVAEGLTFQVFFKAWDQLDRYQIFGHSFLVWLYSIVRNQVMAYHRTHKNTTEPDNEITLAARGGIFREEFQAIREGLQFLTADQQHILILKFIVGMSNENISRLIARSVDDIRVLQIHSLHALADHLIKTDSRTITKGFRRILEDCLTKISTGASTLDECLTRYPQYAAQLQPLLETADLLVLGRTVRPLPTFSAYTHDALAQYVRSHPRRRQMIVMPSLRRMALTFAVLVTALLITGTAHAQSALPGDTFYPWKRTSEQIWRALSPSPIATDIILAERRLEEWIAVADDPILSSGAMNNYQDAISRLESTDDAEAITLITSALKLQRKSLMKAGLSSPELDHYLTGVSNHLFNNAHQQVPTEIWLTGTEVPPAHVSPGFTIDKCAPDCDDDKGNNSNAGGNNNAGGSNAGGNSSNAGGNNSNAGGKGNSGDNDNAGGKDNGSGADNNGKGN